MHFNLMMNHAIIVLSAVIDDNTCNKNGGFQISCHSVQPIANSNVAMA